MSLTYDKGGFKLVSTAGVAGETKGKRCWTRCEVSFMGDACSDLERLVVIKACPDCFLRGQIV